MASTCQSNVAQCQDRLRLEDYLFKIFQKECYAVQQMTREEIERQMDTLSRKYVETHDPEIIEALYQLARLARELEKMEKQGKG
jgi:hypothetical protein